MTLIGSAANGWLNVRANIIVQRAEIELNGSLRESELGFFMIGNVVNGGS